jgi:two-component system sensor histidine kinase/response regulator
MKKPVILCVDDEKVILVSLKQQLKRHFQADYRLEIAESGEEALDIVEELLKEGIELPITISDQMMPVMKGHELLEQIHTISPKTFNILLTGQADADAIGYAVNRANLYRYLSKPWDSDDLKLTVKEALRSYHQERQLIDRTQTLIELNQQKNLFLGIAAHDLKNPLSAIQGYAQMIKSDFDEMPKKEIIEIVDKIDTISHHMFELVTSLLDVNAIEVRQQQISLTRIDLYPILQALVEHYHQPADKKNIQLHCECAKGQYYAWAEQNGIHEVLDNLISNAVKYSSFGQSISVSLAKTPKFIHCKIKDQGPGFSDEDKKKLFGQFARLSAKPTGGEHSSGLGLFIVKKWVEAMQGKVWCDSQLGQGTIFMIELPAA